MGAAVYKYRGFEAQKRDEVSAEILLSRPR